MAYGSLPFLPVQNERLLENLAKEGEKTDSAHKLRLRY